MNKSKRLGFSWDQEYKEDIAGIQSDLVGFGERPGEPSSAEMFMLFLVVGLNSDVVRDVPPRKTDGPRLQFITEEQMALIKAVGLSRSDSPEALLEEDQIFDVAEALAAGGLMLLAKARKEEANFREWVKSKLLDYSRLKIQI